MLADHRLYHHIKLKQVPQKSLNLVFGFDIRFQIKVAWLNRVEKV